MRDLARRTREREARERLGGFRDVGPWEEDCIMNDQPDQPTHPSQSPAPADALAALSVREMTAELTNLQGRLNRDAAGGGYQNCPGRLADGRLWFTASTRSCPSFAAAVPRCLLPRISTFNWAAHRLHHPHHARQQSDSSLGRDRLTGCFVVHHVAGLNFTGCQHSRRLRVDSPHRRPLGPTLK